MAARAYTKATVYTIALVAHIASYIQYHLLQNTLGNTADREVDFTILLVISILLTVLGILRIRKTARFLVLLFRTVAVIFIGLLSVAYQFIQWILLSVLLLEICAFYSPAFSIFWTCFTFAMLVFFQLVYNVFASVWTYKVLSHLFLLLVVSSCSVALGMLIHYLLENHEKLSNRANILNSAINQLTSASTGFLQYASTAAHTSAVTERKRITRDLHDVVGQAFTNIISMMDAVLRYPIKTAEELKNLFRWTRDHAQKGLQESRAVLYALRSIRSEQMRGWRAIKALIDTFGLSTGIQMNVEWGNAPMEFDPELDEVIYHILQEAMTNAFTHGRATKIRISFWSDEAGLQVIIHDNGKGDTQGEKGIGQVGMEERVTTVGGSISFGNVKDGYQVMAQIPV